MLRIRPSRGGKKRQPHYRVVVADVDAKRDGRIVERIGHYNPLTAPVTFEIEEARALYWLSVGAQPSDAVRRLLEKQGTMARLERMRAGESLEDLASEVTGQAPAAAAAATTETEEPKPAKAADVEETPEGDSVAEGRSVVEEGNVDIEPEVLPEDEELKAERLIQTLEEEPDEPVDE